MKKFLLILALLVAATLGAAAYLMFMHPDTTAGQWVKTRYERYVQPYLSPGKVRPTPASTAAEGPAATLDEKADTPVAETPASTPEASETPATHEAPEAKAVPAEKPLATTEMPAAEKAPAKKRKPFSKENWYAGKRLVASDIRGKVVLVYVWDVADERSVAMLARVQQTWDGFRHKPFTVIGSHRGERSKKVLRALKAKKTTFSVYQDAFLPGEPDIPEMPYFYVMNANGKLVYRGVSDMSAVEAVVNAITNMMGR